MVSWIPSLDISAVVVSHTHALEKSSLAKTAPRPFRSDAKATAIAEPTATDREEGKTEEIQR